MEMPLGLGEWDLIAVAVVIGSFLGVLIKRLPENEPFVVQRSRCGECGAPLTIVDLVPLASWFRTGGRCRHCGAWIGWFYPGVEVAALGIAVLSVAVDRGVAAWLDASLGWWLLVLAWIDWRRSVLPDVLTLPLIILGLAAAWRLVPGDLVDRLIGAGCGFVGLWAVAVIYRRARGREGLGFGDAKLFAASGAWVGATGLPSVLAGAAIAGLVAAGALMLSGVRLNRHSAIPFGPFLAAATWLVWLFGPLKF